MSKNIIAETMISGAISKMIELPGAYVINGHVYDKINTAPVPQSFFPHLSGTDCESILKEMSKVGGTGMCGLKTEKSYIQDKKDPNIIYLVSNMNVAMNSGIPQFYKLKKNGYKFTMMGKVPSLMGNTSIGDLDIIDDDATYVYLSYGVVNGGFSILRVHKETLAVTYLNLQLAESNNRVLHTVYNQIIDGKIYVFATIAASLYHVGIKVIDLTTFTSKTFTQPTAMSFAGYMYSDLRKDGDVLTGYFIGKINELWRVQFNIATKVITDSKVADIPIPLVINTEGTAMHFNLNKDYLVITNRNERTIPTGVAESKIVLYKIENDLSVTYKGYLDPGFQYTNYLFSESDDIILIANKFRVDTISITADRTLLKMQSLTPSYLNMLGRDSNGNFFFINDDTSGHVMNREIPIVTTAEFEKEYEFKGTPIASYITIKMQTHLGYNVSGKARVDIVGAAVFTDGTQSKEVDISGITQVPILVVSFGDIALNIVNI